MPTGRHTRYWRGHGDGDLKSPMNHQKSDQKRGQTSDPKIHQDSSQNVSPGNRRMMEIQRVLGLQSLSIGVLGLLLVLTAVHILQGSPLRLPKKDKSNVQFDIQRKRLSQKKIEKPKPRKKKKSSQSRRLKPQLNMAHLSQGLDLGLDILGLTVGDSSLLSQEQTAMTQDVVDSLPVIQYREPVEFPDAAKDEGLSGTVVASLLVSPKGTVEQVKVLDASPVGFFETAAVHSLKRWTFSPAQYQGRPVAIWVKQRLQFKVN